MGGPRAQMPSINTVQRVPLFSEVTGDGGGGLIKAARQANQHHNSLLVLTALLLWQVRVNCPEAFWMGCEEELR